MKIAHAAQWLGILGLAGAGIQTSNATSIIAQNSGSASGNAGYSYSTSYDSTTGYSNNQPSSFGTVTTSGTITGLQLISLTGTVSDPFGSAGRPTFTDSSVGVSLASGEIKIQQDTGPCYSTGIPDCGGLTNAAGTINEGVTFHNTTGLPATIGFLFRVTENVTGGDPRFSSLSGTATFAALSDRLTFDFATCAGFASCGFVDGSRTNGWNSVNMTPSGNFGESFILTAIIAPGDTSTPIFENFNPVCQAGAVCDGTHTAAITFNLPTGVTFTSDSGVFLTQVPTSGAPEPGTWAMLAGGIFLFTVGLARRRAALAKE